MLLDLQVVHVSRRSDELMHGTSALFLEGELPATMENLKASSMVETHSKFRFEVLACLKVLVVPMAEIHSAVREMLGNVQFLAIRFPLRVL